MYGCVSLLANSDAFYQSVPHALDLGDNCGLVQNHVRSLLPAFPDLRAVVNNTSCKVRNAHLMHGCGRIPLPHFERFGSSQPWKPDPTDFIPSEAVVEEHEGVLVDGLRLGRSTTI